jgi:hypothetical protein
MGNVNEPTFPVGKITRAQLNANPKYYNDLVKNEKWIFVITQPDWDFKFTRGFYGFCMGYGISIEGKTTNKSWWNTRSISHVFYSPGIYNLI